MGNKDKWYCHSQFKVEISKIMSLFFTLDFLSLSGILLLSSQ